MNDVTSPETIPPPTKATRLRRLLCRAFFLLFVFGASIDVTPWGWFPTDRPKHWVAAAMSSIGLSQGQWSMFTPTPSVNNMWLTADFEAKKSPNSNAPDEQWSSPYWMTIGGWEKFHRFRHMNYYNRIQLLQNRAAADDFADFLRRHGPPPTPMASASYPVESYPIESHPTENEYASVKLFTNGVRIMLDDTDSLPSPDEILWITYSDPIARSPRPQPNSFRSNSLFSSANDLEVNLAAPNSQGAVE